jgi:hypothetical protein
MPQTEARPWWADVQPVREAIERRRGGTDHAGGDAAAVRDATAVPAGTRLLDETAPPAAPPRWERFEQGSERVDRRRPPRRPAEWVGQRPDRIALWAALLGFFLILVAAASSHAATPAGHQTSRLSRPSAMSPATPAFPSADARLRLRLRLREAPGARRAG